jgi:hypothetical protein
MGQPEVLAGWLLALLVIASELVLKRFTRRRKQEQWILAAAEPLVDALVCWFMRKYKPHWWRKA